jgi:hypothetical protein
VRPKTLSCDEAIDLACESTGSLSEDAQSGCNDERGVCQWQEASSEYFCWCDGVESTVPSEEIEGEVNDCARALSAACE